MATSHQFLGDELNDGHFRGNLFLGIYIHSSVWTYDTVSNHHIILAAPQS
jgi:hypothetical protein